MTYRQAFRANLGQETAGRRHLRGFASGNGRPTLLPILIRLTLCLAFIPFFSIVPASTDVQPLFYVAAILSILASGNLRLLTGPDVAFLLLLTISLMYALPAAEQGPMPIIRIAAAFVAYYFFRRYVHLLNQRVILVMTLLHTALLLLNFLYPEQFVRLLAPFVFEMRSQVIGIRGASGLAPEPGFAGAVSVFLLATSMLLRDYKGDGRYYRAVFLMSVLGVFLTRSGTGSLLLIGVVFVYYLRRLSVRSAIIVGASAIGVVWLLQTVDIGRGYGAIALLLENPERALSQDASMGARAINFVLGIVAVSDAPLGHGIGSYDVVAPTVAAKHGLFDFFAGGIGMNSAFATYSVEIGLVWWCFLAYMFYRGVRIGGMTGVPYLLLSAYFISTSFSLSFPPTWLLLATTHISPEAWMKKTARVEHVATLWKPAIR